MKCKNQHVPLSSGHENSITVVAPMFYLREICIATPILFRLTWLQPLLARNVPVVLTNIDEH